MLFTIRNIYYKFKVYILHLTLIEEIKKGCIDTAKVLINNSKSSINTRDIDGRTALHWAVIEKNSNIVELLLNHPNIDINATNKYGTTALMLAAKNNNLEAVLNMAFNENSNINAKDKDGYTALHWATKRAHTEVITKLIDAGADVNAKDSSGSLALYWAIRHNNKEIVIKLINVSANINAGDKCGCTALMLAANSNYKEIVKILIDAGADVNAQNIYGHTALHQAARYACVEIVNFLLNKGADVSIKDQNDCTALYYGVIGNSIKITELFLNHCKYHKINIIDIENKAILIEAVKCNNIDTVKTLINIGADVNFQDKKGQTALMWAAKYCYTKIVKILLDKDVNINTKDIDGNTALHLAVKSGYLEIVNVFLDSNIDIDAKDKDGYTALHLAVKYNYIKIIKKLLDKNADISTTDNHNKTILELTIEKRNIEIVKLLISYGVQEIEIKNSYNNASKKLLEILYIVKNILASPNLYNIIEEVKKDTTELLYKNFLARTSNIKNSELVLNNQFIKQLQLYNNETDQNLKKEIVEKVKLFIAKAITTEVMIKTEGKLDKNSKNYIVKLVVEYITNNTIPNKYKDTPQECFKMMSTANPFVRKELIESLNDQLEVSYQDLAIIFYSISDLLQVHTVPFHYEDCLLEAVKIIKAIAIWQQKDNFTQKDQDIINKYKSNPIEFLSIVINSIDIFIKDMFENTAIFKQLYNNAFNATKAKELEAHLNDLRSDLNSLEVLEPLLDGSLQIIKTKEQKTYLNNLKDSLKILNEYYDLLYLYFQLLESKEYHEIEQQYYGCTVKGTIEPIEEATNVQGIIALS